MGKASLLHSKALRHFLKSPFAVCSALVVLFFMLAAGVGPFFAPQNPYDLSTVSILDGMKPPAWMEGGTPAYLFGTDVHGRDILSLILWGTRTSLLVGFVTVILAGTIGMAVGLLSGFYGGPLAGVLMRIADMAYAFPSMLMAILVMGILGRRGVSTVILALAAVAWVRYARVTYAKALSEKEKEYVLAAKGLGFGKLRIMLKHLLPNCMAPLFIIGTVDIAVFIIIEASLSFLGVGVSPAEPSLGMIIADARPYLFVNKWWLIVFPGGALMTVVAGINLFGDWLREELNPKIQNISV